MTLFVRRFDSCLSYVPTSIPRASAREVLVRAHERLSSERTRDARKGVRQALAEEQVSVGDEFYARLMKFCANYLFFCTIFAPQKQ